ncbi:accessory gene regulator B family protein [Alkalicella caledoniensis]|uniref:Accessory gene regulator B family protein n=1 Tax=Alkalicella caledoniensis TaxID=2731377 RepID=A0A7G9WB45_ALKCA|nr:accessory gene regulator B family protein [Alkalicella caledoniensis]QNO15907.1 accessory gene regulator B family protein [Alkalicella caledoniensis]
MDENVFFNRGLRVALRMGSIFIFLVAGYQIFFTSNYDLNWTYLIFTLSIIAFFVFSPRDNRSEENSNSNKGLRIWTMILIILSLALSIYNYRQYYSIIIHEAGEYSFTSDTTPYFAIEEPSKIFEGISPSIHPIFNLEKYIMDDVFVESLLRDVSNFEGKSLFFFQIMNIEKIRFKEGKPVEVYFPIEKDAPQGQSGPIIVKIFPNEMVFTVIYMRGSGLRTYQIDYSQETMEYLTKIYNKFGHD